MISICIPTYEQKGQGAYYLSLLLQSITTQVFSQPYEVVISDNATDGSIRAVVDKYQDRLPIRYEFNPQRGASENINNAIALARYDRVKLMMQDDLFSNPQALEYFNNALNVWGWVVCNSNHINALGQRTGGRVPKYDPANFDSNTVGMPSVMAFNKAHAQPPYFDTNLKTFCDLYFYYKLYDTYGPPGVVNLPQPLVSQRFHNASLSRNQPPSHAKDKRYLISRGLIPGTIPKVVVAVIVYKRYDNINRWLQCWGQCETNGAQLVIIQNVDGVDPDYPGNISEQFSQYKNVTYLTRSNVGYDIGAFQDVCKRRLPGFPDYDYLLWCTDDTIPMQKDFISPFLDSFDKSVGITCMQISNEYRRHVRTTGFCIWRDLAENLRWPVDPITTVQQCWHFEHRGGAWTLTRQVEARGLRCIQVAPLEKSPLYDMGFWYRNPEALKLAPQKDRMNEHNSIFNTQQYSQEPKSALA